VVNDYPMFNYRVKGGESMKRLISIVLLAVLALSLSACAGMGKKETSRVKCPACGYEFDTPKEQSQLP
jgi:hypothetical protein